MLHNFHVILFPITFIIYFIYRSFLPPYVVTRFSAESTMDTVSEDVNASEEHGQEIIVIDDGDENG